MRVAWICNPAVAVHLASRFKVRAVHAEIARLVRADPSLVEDVPEALAFFVGDSISNEIQPKLRVSCSTFLNSPSIADVLLNSTFCTGLLYQSLQLSPSSSLNSETILFSYNMLYEFSSITLSP